MERERGGGGEKKRKRRKQRKVKTYIIGKLIQAKISIKRQKGKNEEVKHKLTHLIGSQRVFLV